MPCTRRWFSTTRRCLTNEGRGRCLSRELAMSRLIAGILAQPYARRGGLLLPDSVQKQIDAPVLGVGHEAGNQKRFRVGVNQLKRVGCRGALPVVLLASQDR